MVVDVDLGDRQPQVDAHHIVVTVECAWITLGGGGFQNHAAQGVVFVTGPVDGVVCEVRPGDSGNLAQAVIFGVGKHSTAVKTNTLFTGHAAQFVCISARWRTTGGFGGGEQNSACGCIDRTAGAVFSTDTPGDGGPGIVCPIFTGLAPGTVVTPTGGQPIGAGQRKHHAMNRVVGAAFGVAQGVGDGDRKTAIGAVGCGTGPGGDTLPRGSGGEFVAKAVVKCSWFRVAGQRCRVR